MLAEEVPVVPEEQDQRVVELATPLEGLEQHPDALVDRRHHGRPWQYLLLRPGQDRPEQTHCGVRPPEGEGFGEGRP